MIRALVALALAIPLVIGACGAACGCVTLVNVYGASSLTNVVTTLTGAYTGVSPNSVQFINTFGSSAALRTQIEQGAPAGIFLSADTANPQALIDEGLVDGGLLEFATNRLTLIVPAGNPANIASLADLARPGVKVIAAGDDVPISKYANQVVANLAGIAGYPADFAALYEANVVSKEDNVAAVLSKIELGEGDAAIVYVTDAATVRVEHIDIPDSANVTATYAGVILKHAQGSMSAHRFLDWLRSFGAVQILTRAGFGTP